MRAHDLGADRDHLHPWKLLADHRALEPAMHDNELRGGSEDALPGLPGELEEVRIESGCPGWIRPSVLDFGARESADAVDRGGHVVERMRGRAPRHRAQSHNLVVRLDQREARARLDD